MDHLQPLLILLLFVPSLAAGAACAALMLGAERVLHINLDRAKKTVAFAWWLALSATLWIGSNHLFSSREADTGVFFAAILVWIFVVLPAPFVASWIIGVRRNSRNH